MIITMKRVSEIGQDDYLAFYISAIICIDGLFDHLCDISEEYSEENENSPLYYFTMIWSVTYNAYLAKWGS